MPSGRHDIWPSDHDQRGNPLPSSRTSRRRSRPALVRAASWLASSSTSGPDSTCGQPPLTVFTTVVWANAIVYDSQLDLLPSGSPSRATCDQRSPALLARGNGGQNVPRRGAPPTRGPGSSGVKARRCRTASRSTPPAAPNVLATLVVAAWLTQGLGQSWLHRTSNRWPRLLSYTVAGLGQRCLVANSGRLRRSAHAEVGSSHRTPLRLLHTCADIRNGHRSLEAGLVNRRLYRR